MFYACNIAVPVWRRHTLLSNKTSAIRIQNPVPGYQHGSPSTETDMARSIHTPGAVVPCQPRGRCMSDQRLHINQRKAVAVGSAVRVVYISVQGESSVMPVHGWTVSMLSRVLGENRSDEGRTRSPTWCKSQGLKPRCRCHCHVVVPSRGENVVVFVRRFRCKGRTAIRPSGYDRLAALGNAVPCESQVVTWWRMNFG